MYDVIFMPESRTAGNVLPEKDSAGKRGIVFRKRKLEGTCILLRVCINSVKPLNLHEISYF